MPIHHKIKRMPKIDAMVLAASSLIYEPDTGLFYWKDTGDIANLTPVGDGYSSICLGGHHLRAHRIAFMIMKGTTPPQIDHVNRIKTDNRWQNLRSATPSDNAANTVKRAPNRNGFRGVERRFNKYRAEIVRNGKRHRTGWLSDPAEAANAYVLMSRELNGLFSPF
jgi:hypothetical protein